MSDKDKLVGFSSFFRISKCNFIQIFIHKNNANSNVRLYSNKKKIFLVVLQFSLGPCRFAGFRKFVRYLYPIARTVVMNRRKKSKKKLKDTTRLSSRISFHIAPYGHVHSHSSSGLTQQK